jgi:hypothetical protein
VIEQDDLQCTETRRAKEMHRLQNTLMLPVSDPSLLFDGAAITGIGLRSTQGRIQQLPEVEYGDRVGYRQQSGSPEPGGNIRVRQSARTKALSKKMD